MGPTAKVVYKKLASMIVSKHNQPYSQTINWLCCRLSFSLRRSCIICLRGSRSSTDSWSHHWLCPLQQQSELYVSSIFFKCIYFCSLGLFLNCLSYSFYCIACTIHHYYFVCVKKKNGENIRSVLSIATSVFGNPYQTRTWILASKPQNARVN